MIWLNFLHFYQPANAPDHVIAEALNQSYWRLLRLMEEHPHLRMTWNISACLVERLAVEKNFLNRLKILLKEKRVELTSSAAYHGLLPLLPDVEIIRQIEESKKIFSRYFGASFKPTGFFLPEMAYSSRVAQLIKKRGYEWIILDEISSLTPVTKEQFFYDAASGLKVIFRDSQLSSSYPPDIIMAAAGKKNINQPPSVYITATDAELYGLHHQDPSAELEKTAKLKNLRTLTISEWLKINKQSGQAVRLRPSSWEVKPSDIKAGQPFSLWKDKNNKIQVDLWRLAKLALSLHEKFQKDTNFYWYRWHLVRGLASCTFWWASARDFSHVFGPYAWSPDEIERGLEDMIRSIRSLASSKSYKYKLAAEKIYLRIKKNIWREHWQKRWRK